MEINRKDLNLLLLLSILLMFWILVAYWFFPENLMPLSGGKVGGDFANLWTVAREAL